MLDVHNRRSQKTIAEIEELKAILRFFFPPIELTGKIDSKMRHKALKARVSYGMRAKSLINKLHTDMGFDTAKLMIYYAAESLRAVRGTSSLNVELFSNYKDKIQAYQNGVLIGEEKEILFQIFSSIEKEYVSYVPPIKKRKKTRQEVL